MKKIGIVTIIDGNYGNRLQNYALQEYLKECGYDVVTLSNKEPSEKDILTLKIKSSIAGINRWVVRPYWRWEIFNYKFIRFRYYSSKLELANLVDEFDAFIVGSDQVWNPILYYFDADFMFLKFAGEEKRISYAASFGISSLPDDFESQFKEGLMGFSDISVRESDGADIVYNLTGKRVPVVLDPTMLIDAKAWSKLGNKSILKCKTNYLLKYFLGERNHKVELEIEQYAKSMGLKIIDISREKMKDEWRVGPKEFLWLIEHAQVVCTDSFHGSVFSILFQKQFWVFQRPYQKDTGSMNSRIYTLLNSFNLEERLVLAEGKLSDQEIMYDKVCKLLSQRRKEGERFINAALNGGGQAK